MNDTQSISKMSWSFWDECLDLSIVVVLHGLDPVVTMCNCTCRNGELCNCEGGVLNTKSSESPSLCSIDYGFVEDASEPTVSLCSIDFSSNQ